MYLMKNEVNFVQMFISFYDYENFKGNPFTEVQWLKTVSPTAGGGDGGGAGKGKLQSLKGIVAGGITGAIEICITYPTEYVKTQLQLDSKGASKQYSGPGDVIKKTINKYGFFGLYRGLTVLLYGAIPKVASRFGAYESFKGLLSDSRGQLSPQALVLTGLGAGIVEAILVVTPLETVKVKLINDRRSAKPRFKGIFHCVSLIVKEEGIGGIYQGTVPTVLRQGSNAAIRFFIMDTLKDMYRAGDKSVIVPKPVTALMGIFAGIFSTFGNAPIDVIKTRMQGLEAKKYKSSLDCFMKMLREEGFKSFYKGTTPRLIRVCMDCAITFTIYDSFMEFFNRVWP